MLEYRCIEESLFSINQNCFLGELMNIKWFVLLSCILFKAPCFCLTPSDMQKFIKEYSASPEKHIGWSKIIYAIEKDFDDDLARFYIEKEGFVNPIYKRQKNWRQDNSPIQQNNVLITCLRKNKLELIHAILQSKNPPMIDAKECWFAKDMYSRTEEIKERRILNIAIEECTNSLELVQTLLDYGADLNSVETYKSDPYGCGNSKSINYSRTPLEAAIIVKKYDIAKYLVERGATFNGKLPLIITYGDLDLLEFFLQIGASPYEGLETSVRLRDKEALILLLNYGANPLSVIDLAVQIDDQEIIDILMEAIFKDQSEI